MDQATNKQISIFPLIFANGSSHGDIFIVAISYVFSYNVANKIGLSNLSFFPLSQDIRSGIIPI